MTTQSTHHASRDTRHQWLLIDTLGPHEHTVVGVGDTSRRATPLQKFLRGSHRTAALDAVRSASDTGRRHDVTAGHKRVTAEPILDHSGRTRAVWLLISPVAEAPAAPPSAHAFEWNLTRGTAITMAAPHHGRLRAVADAIEPHDLGVDAAPALGHLVAAHADTAVQLTTVQATADHAQRRVSVTGHIRLERATGDRVFHGLSHDLGPSPLPPQSDATHLSDLIVHSLLRPREHLAIVDPATLMLLVWHTAPPPGLAWRSIATKARPVIHPEDLPCARLLATAVQQPAATARTSETIRLLHETGHYEKYEISAAPLPLSAKARAALVTVRRMGEVGAGSSADVV